MMVNYGRADYWLDAFLPTDPTLQSYLAAGKNTKLEFLYPNPVRLAFADTEKRRYYKEILDQGLNELLHNPEELRRIYFGELLNVPSASGFLEARYKDYYSYLRANYPELKLP